MSNTPRLSGGVSFVLNVSYWRDVGISQTDVALQNALWVTTAIFLAKQTLDAVILLVFMLESGDK
jgi:hypothetical protein